MTARCIPLHETVEASLNTALGRPGLAHLRTHVELCRGGDETSAMIDFRACGASMGVILMIAADNSFTLMDHGKSVAHWDAEEAQPSTITKVVVEALHRRVAA